MIHCLEKSWEDKDPHRDCVSVILYLISKPRALESSTLNDKHRFGFRRVLDSANCAYAHFFIAIHFTRDNEAEL